MELTNAFTSALPVILLVISGFFLRRFNLFSPETIAQIKNFILKVPLPLVLFQSFANMQFQPRFLLLIGLVFSLCWGIMWLAGLLRPLLGFRSAYFPFLMTAFEAGMMGYALFGTIYGLERISQFAVVDLGQVLFVWFVLATRLQRIQQGRSSFRATLMAVIRNPIIVGVILGIFLNLTGLYRLLLGWQFAPALVNTMQLLAGVTMPLVALLVGYELRFQAGSLAAPLKTALLKMALWAGVAILINTFLIERLAGTDPIFKAAVLLLFLMPAPFMVPLYMQKSVDSQDRDYVLNTLSISTLLALAGVVVVRLIYAP